ncbi:hypothetical protein Mal33_45510 [Rosistilla oblonga]|uniref:Uncharacterized protein n=1 Tax=Rosistilla oblonga TaxID=2527990 RepID=A0A518IZK6_9BACT|nr:hypothetical protein Mal33_45510 [Rosistilla oblonga]
MCVDPKSENGYEVRRFQAARFASNLLHFSSESAQSVRPEVVGRRWPNQTSD